MESLAPFIVDYTDLRTGEPARRIFYTEDAREQFIEQNIGDMADIEEYENES